MSAAVLNGLSLRSGGELFCALRVALARFRQSILIWGNVCRGMVTSVPMRSPRWMMTASQSCRVSGLAAIMIVSRLSTSSVMRDDVFFYIKERMSYGSE